MNLQRRMQAIAALKKGAHLLKCGKRGKPRFCPFRLSCDENLLIWYSKEKQKSLSLSSVSECGSWTENRGESIYGAPFADEFHSRLRFNHKGLLVLWNPFDDIVPRQLTKIQPAPRADAERKPEKKAVNLQGDYHSANYWKDADSSFLKL
ncbi:putative E3 ubiquitin-protein ligase HERC2 [Hordeum vulgare]|nr:putative E3 ubiquitin-protein ligase HERC2 [Hordeum vulgare]